MSDSASHGDSGPPVPPDELRDDFLERLVVGYESELRERSARLEALTAYTLALEKTLSQEVRRRHLVEGSTSFRVGSAVVQSAATLARKPRKGLPAPPEPPTRRPSFLDGDEARADEPPSADGGRLLRLWEDKPPVPAPAVPAPPGSHWHRERGVGASAVIFVLVTDDDARGAQVVAEVLTLQQRTNAFRPLFLGTGPGRQAATAHGWVYEQVPVRADWIAVADPAGWDEILQSRLRLLHELYRPVTVVPVGDDDAPLQSSELGRLVTATARAAAAS